MAQLRRDVATGTSAENRKNPEKFNDSDGMRKGLRFEYMVDGTGLSRGRKKQMKHSGVIVAIIASSLAVTAGAALAQKPGGGPRAPIAFDKVDQDGNGEISKQEFATRHRAGFDAADANGDGALDRAEMLLEAQTRNEARVDAMIARFDENGDGVLSRDEMPKPRDSRRADKFFDRADKDENGSISKAEYEKAQDHMSKHRSHKN